jgi:hypothetical protein
MRLYSDGKMWESHCDYFFSHRGFEERAGNRKVEFCIKQNTTVNLIGDGQKMNHKLLKG